MHETLTTHKVAAALQNKLIRWIKVVMDIDGATVLCHNILVGATTNGFNYQG